MPRSQFDQELNKMHFDLDRMCHLVVLAIENCVTAFKEQDYELAQDIIHGDKQINDVERSIEAKCLSLILKQQPVASDLRDVSTALKVVTDLERIGDQSADIAELILEMKEITRFGFVGTYFIQKTNPISEIQTKFIKNEKQKQNLEELSIRYNSRSSYENLTLNDVVEISKGEINGTQEGIVIRRDFNNIPVNSLELSLLLSTIEAHKSKFVQSGIMELI